MIVTFHIEYRTSWGEEVRILGSVPELGKNNPEQAVALKIGRASCRERV